MGSGTRGCRPTARFRDPYLCFVVLDAQDPIDGRARPVYRAAEAHALLADVLAQLDEGEPLAPPGLRRNAQFGVGGFIATLPDMAPQGIAM